MELLLSKLKHLIYEYWTVNRNLKYVQRKLFIVS